MLSENTANTSSSLKMAFPKNINTEGQLCRDIGQLLLDESSYTDVSLKCSSVIYRAHKCILSSRSPVFAAMFRIDMLESQGTPVNIPDIEPVTFRAMLSYIYTGKTEGMTGADAAKLLFAADKYQLEELKLICVDHLKSNTSLENVVQTLLVGELHDLDLKEHAVAFICRLDKFAMLEKKEEWKSLCKENADLAVEVLVSVVKYKEQFTAQPAQRSGLQSGSSAFVFN